MEPHAEHVDNCDYCGQAMDMTSCRWRCPRCGMKHSCCEGAPQPERGFNSD